MKIIPDRCLFFLVVCAVLFMIGCGEQQGSQTDATDQPIVADTSGKSPEHLAIERELNDVLLRLKYGDKTGLYENEFEYFLDDCTYDDYLGMGPIRYAEADSVVYMDIRNIEFFGHDSAALSITVHFRGPAGKDSYYRDKFLIYWHRGRWIKPTVSVIDLQLAYEDKIRVADSAAAAEAAEGH